MAATMAMCHQTLTWLRMATTLMPTMLRARQMSMSTPIVTSRAGQDRLFPLPRMTVVLL